jgi:signal transduction histidine kinase
MTLRWRLTLLYELIFLVCSGLMLATAYLLVSDVLAGQSPVPPKIIAVGSVPPTGRLPLVDGRTVDVEQYRLELARSLAESRTANEAYHADILRALLTRGSLAIGAAAPAALLLGWFAAGQGLRPLRRVTMAARRIAGSSVAEGLRARVVPRGPHDEVYELSEAFDAMLTRLDDAFGAQRQFIANAAHEMRAPLALERTLLEVALLQPDADIRTLREHLLAANRRQSDTLEGLLVLASAEQDEQRPRPVALDAVVAAELATVEAGDTPIRESISPAWVLGDAALLALLVRNLIDNALRYNVPDGWVEVTLGSDGPDGADARRVVLTVENSGPRLVPDQVPRLFEPFSRGPAARTSSPAGVGLGLSIVRAIVRAHSGRILATARPDGGLLVRVQLGSSEPGPFGRSTRVPVH